jgi:membrane-bound lytic murein transglycosylase D
LVWLLPLCLAGCSTLPDAAHERAAMRSPGTAAADDTIAFASTAPDRCELPLTELQPYPLWDRLRHGFALDRSDHPRVERERQRLLQSPTALRGLLEAATPWLYHIAEQVEQRGLPMELALLPAVESGFRPYSYSRSGAAGLWQFMPATGRMRGLTQDWWFDGRRDVIAGTDAALEHLQSLHRRLDGDWLHALAAYNAGRGTVNRAVRKNRERGKATDFWSLDLPGETDIYVPRLLALTDLVRDPQHYGITLPELPNHPQFAVVDIGSQLDLGVAARASGVPLEQLASLNAGLNRLATPPNGPHRLLVPQARADQLRAALSTLPVEQRLQRDRYRVKPGDTLSGIASRHGITVAALQSANGLQSHRIRAGQDLLVPRYGSALALAPVKTSLPHSRVKYRVRSGDSLYEIAQKFRVSVGQLRRWNRLSGNLLKPGQQLTLFVDPARQTL